MSSRRLHSAFIAVFAVFLFAFFRGLDTGMLGHDYFFFFTKLLDGKWHFLRQGLLPFWYTVHYCGGMPEFGNPQGLYYSLPQLLSLFLDLWVTVRLSMLFAMVAGYAGWYRFGRDLIRLAPAWAHVLALIVIAHGFYFMHMLPGHLVFHGMPLLGWMLWLIFERTGDTPLSLLRKSAWFSLLAAYAVYGGGYFIGVMGAFALLALLPFELILHADNAQMLQRRLRILAKRLLACSIGAMAMCGSKIVAVWSFMRFVPRILPFERFKEGSSALWYFLKASFAMPQGDALFQSIGMPDWGAIHEYSLFLSPVVALGLLAGIVLVWKRRDIIRKNRSQAIACAAAAAALFYFFLQLARGYGWLVTPMEHLPILKSLHENMRYLYAFSFLPICASVWCLQTLAAESALQRRSTMLALFASAVTVATFVGAYAPLIRGQTALLPLTLPYEFIRKTIAENGDFLKRPMQEIMDTSTLGHSEFVPLFFGGNDLYCKDPMVWGSGKFPPQDLKIGSVGLAWDGAYNINNPACMDYPEANHCAFGDRISFNDTPNMKLFLLGYKTTWKMSVLQHIANWTSLIVFIASVIMILPWKWMKRQRPIIGAEIRKSPR